MVPFAGYSMPVQYPTGIIAEHKWTREHAGLFDVSHMGPSFLTLAGEIRRLPRTDHAAVAAVVEPLMSGDIRGLKPGQIRYTLLLNDAGGILDDLMVARSARIGHGRAALYIVVNAGTKDADFARIAATAGERADSHTGPTTARCSRCRVRRPRQSCAMLVPGRGRPRLHDLRLVRHGADERLIISRSGYTGEDGFEILAPAEQADALWNSSARR